MSKQSKVLTFGERELGVVWTDEVDLPIAIIDLEKQKSRRIFDTKQEAQKQEQDNNLLVIIERQLQVIKQFILCETLKDILSAEYAQKVRDTNKQNFIIELHNRHNIFGYIKFMSSPLKESAKS